MTDQLLPAFIPATPVESAQGFDMMRAALVALLARRAVRGSVKTVRITKRERDRLAAALNPGERLRLRIAMTADESIDLWLELVPDDGTRAGVVTVNAQLVAEPVP